MECVTDYAIFFLDPHGRVATWNAGAERIFRYREAEIVGQHFSHFSLPKTFNKAYRRRNSRRRRRRGGRMTTAGWYATAGRGCGATA